jgi:hypothetical protein
MKVKKVQTRKDAIDFLGAVRIAPDLFAYLAEEVDQWYVITPQELDKLVVALEKDPRDGYSEWCSYTGREATSEEARRAEEISWIEWSRPR